MGKGKKKPGSGGKRSGNGDAVPPGKRSRADAVAASAKGQLATKDKETKHKDAAADEEPTLEEIVSMGGSQSDLEWIRSGMPSEHKGPVEADEIQSLWQSLGFAKFSAGSSAAAAKGRKKASQEDEEEESEEEESEEEESEEEESEEEEGDESEEEEEEEQRPAQDSPAAIPPPASKAAAKAGKKEAANPAKSAPPQPAAADPGPRGSAVKRTKAIIVGTAPWFEQTENAPKVMRATGDLLAWLKARKSIVDEMLENESVAFDEGQSKLQNRDQSWLRSIAAGGTMGDRLAAMMLRVQESPIHRLKELQQLLGIAQKKSKRESLLAIDTLRELWLSLLPDRKLRLFSQRPVERFVPGASAAGDAKLMLWGFEDRLKVLYGEFVTQLEGLLREPQASIKTKILNVVFDLLSNKPEQEKQLLFMLVNEMGEPERRVAAKAAHLLSLLVVRHPAMKMVVAKEVEQLLYRPNIHRRAQQTAICFLNQLQLSRQEADVAMANHLMTIYFQFFEKYIKAGEVESKLLSAIITGVNRAHPFAQVEEALFDKHIDMLFKVLHIGTFNVSVQALMLLLQVMDARKAVSDRYYRALYEKLLDPALGTSSKQAMFLNVLLRSMKSDPSINRVKAFVKRLLQVCASLPAPFICGGLLVVSELFKVKPTLSTMTSFAEEDDDDEVYHDMPESDDEQGAPEEEEDEEEEGEEEEEEESRQEKRRTDAGTAKGNTASYDMSKREPMFAGAELTCLWELNVLAQHWHPSVGAFSRYLLRGEAIAYDSDPLQDFSLMRFLDRFVFKNPKQKPSDHGGSIMQPKRVGKRIAEEPVNTGAFLAKNEEQVDPDDVFYHRYFKEKARREGRAGAADGAEHGSAMAESGDELAFSDDDSDGAPAGGAGAGDGEEFDYDTMLAGMADSDDDEDEGELDLEAIAREGFGEDEDEANGYAASLLGSKADKSPFVDADEFARILEEAGEEDRGRAFERRRAEGYGGGAGGGARRKGGRKGGRSAAAAAAGGGGGKGKGKGRGGKGKARR